MAALNSTSTLAEIEAAYMDNASYAEDGSAAKARAFVTACRLLILKTPKMTGTREAQLTLSPELLAGQIDEANAWLASNGGGPAAAAAGGNGVPAATSVRVSFRNPRD
ncbi:MAG TPA: hypothetical protein VF796_01865 [Humisphaera sp.]